jgi:hypothetical protein
MTNYARFYRFRGDYYDSNTSQKIEKVNFFNFSLSDMSIELSPKKVDTSLNKVLSNSFEHDELKIDERKIDKVFLGLSSPQPNSQVRFPFWLSSEMISNHVLVAGQIGSGKTSLLYRIIAGALNSYGTVVIGEVKGGNGGYAEGAAFTKLSIFLQRELRIHTYRWPRGNCWFNPLKYLTDLESRKIFFNGICDSIPLGNQGDLRAYLGSIAEMANLLAEFLHQRDVILNMECKSALGDISNLLGMLKKPEEARNLIQDLIKEWQLYLEFTEYYIKNTDANLKAINVYTEALQLGVKKCSLIFSELSRLNFFALGSSEGQYRFINTYTAWKFFINSISYDDLLYYSSYHQYGKDGQELIELTLDHLLYDRSLVVISQPANHPASGMIGNFFWESLLDRVTNLGLFPPTNNGKSRQKIAVILDETQRLPVGRLGESGDFLRQFNIGLIEVFPSIKDRERWEESKNVYRTIISLSQGIPDVVNLMHSYLPSQSEDLIRLSLHFDGNGLLGVTPKINDDYYHLSQDNPGISLRSLNHTGKYTALLWSNVVGESKLFWIDLESQLLGYIDYLLNDALTGDQSSIELAQYTLGLILECSPKKTSGTSDSRINT